MAANSREMYQNYRFCYDNGHQQWLETAKRCFEFWRGRQWDQQSKAKLNREGRPALTFNVVESLVRSMKGIQRALRNDVRFLPVENAGADDARVHDALWMHIQNQNDMEFLETDIFEKGLIFGRAYYDVRVAYDDSYQGNVQIRGRRSQDVILDPSVDQYDPAMDWPQIFDRRWVSYNDLVHLWGKEKASAIGYNPSPAWYDYEDEFMSQQMGQMPYYQADGLEDTAGVRAHLLLNRQYFVYKMKDVFVDMATGDTSEIPESWDRERVGRVLEGAPGTNTMKRKIRTVRWSVSCENEIMHDEDSPYDNFTIVPYFPSFVDGVTMSAVESLLDPQELFNKITSQELHIINTTANSGWKVRTGALKNMTIEELEQVGSRSGFVAELDDISNMEKITPNQTPQGHDRLSFKADQIMRSLSGVSNQARGFAREDVAGEAILANQAAQDINFAGYLGNLHRTKRMVASRVQDCVQAHYTETRVIQINRGTVFTPQMEEIPINEPSAEGKVLNDVTKGRFSTVLVPAPSRTTLSNEDFKLLVMLRQELGIAIPDAMLIELSPASNKSQIMQALGGDSNERQRAAEEAAAKKAELEMRTEAAKAGKEETAGMLNKARAEKFAIEAQSDPDAAYERVEQERIAAEQANSNREFALDRERFDHEKAQDARELAVTLTELDIKREIANKQAEVKQQQAAAKPKAAPKKSK